MEGDGEGRESVLFWNPGVRGMYDLWENDQPVNPLCIGVCRLFINSFQTKLITTFVLWGLGWRRLPMKSL